MLGDQIRDLRNAKNLSQIQLAERLGVTKQTVSNWENNNILPSVDMLKRIANYFHCDTDYLLEMNEGKVYIETTYLTLEQTMHIQQLVEDLSTINQRLTSSQESK